MQATTRWMHIRKTCLAVVTFLAAMYSYAAAAEDTPDILVPLKQIAISADFDALGKGISQTTLLRIANEKRATLPEYVSYSNLLEIKDTLTQYMRDKGYKFHRASLPVQQLDQGNVSFSIQVVLLDDVEINNKTKISDQTFSDVFAAHLGKPVHQPNITKSLARLRSTPLIKVFAFYSRGSAPNSVRLNVKAEPKRAWNTNIGIDNYGTSSIGEERLIVQTQWHNPTLAMDALNAAILVSNGDEQLNTYGYISYMRPILGLKNRVRVSASNNIFQLGDNLATLDLDGDASIYSASFERDLKSSDTGAQTAAFSVESRSTDYGGFFQDELDESSELYAFRWQLSHSRKPSVRHYALLSYAQGDVTFGLNPKRSFNRTRLNYKLTLTPESLLESRFASQIQLSLRTQFAPEKVSSFDQFSLTGSASVRAIKPGQFSVDTGYIGEIQWRLPSLVRGPDRVSSWRLTPFLALDFAQGDKLDEEGETLESGTLLGTGLGLAFSHRSGLSSKMSVMTALQKEVDVFGESTADTTTRELDASNFLFELYYRW